MPPRNQTVSGDCFTGNGKRLFFPLLILLFLAGAIPCRAALLCSVPGKDGPGNPAGIVNTYYPGTASVSSGAMSIPVGAPSGNIASPIAAGDLLVVMQMQDADINYANNNNYGAGDGSGSGYTALNQTGLYEYAIAAGPVAGGSVPLASPLVNSYRRRTATVTNGQSTFQVIRVPQYSTASVSGTVSALFWNGSVGGVVAMDVAGTLTNNGTITADGAGFRGGWGEAAASAGPDTDYLYRATGAAVGNGMKGEGIAGSPNRLNQPNSFNGAPNQVATGSLGYPSGANSDASKGRGAPGNAGGGGTDGNTANDENSGGGGGGNYAAGAKGGNSWNSNLDVGGRGGAAAAPLAFNRVVMGGGGGAGTTNNSTADNATYSFPSGIACTAGAGACSSGAPGGGIVLLRATSIGGSGTITANGGSAYNVLNDGAGGGGAGGTVVLDTIGGGSATIQVNGGDGGNAWRSHTTLIDRHGPGGGGSGGFIAYAPASGFTINPAYSGGISGKSCNGDAYGSTSSSGGMSTFQSSNVAGPRPGGACLPSLTVSKTTSTPAIANLPGTARYTITVANAPGTSTANNVTISDRLPGAPALFTNNTPPVSVTYQPNTAPCNVSRITVGNPSAATSIPAWSNWNLPGGCAVSLTFDAQVPSGTVPAVYQNEATATYDDPVNIGLRKSVSYNPASSTAEDVKVLAPPVVAKTFGASSIAAGGSTTVTLTLTNPNSTPITGVTFTDTLPASASGAPGNMTILNPPAPSSTCGGGAGITAGNGTGIFTVGAPGYTIPANSSCAVTFTVTAPSAGIYVNTIPAGAVSSSSGSNSQPATASLTVGPGLLPPHIAKSFLTNPMVTGAVSTLRFTLTNPNGTMPIDSAGFIDTLPAELVLASPVNLVNSCGGSVTAAAGTGYISLNTDGTIPAGGSCQISVDVTSTTAGIYTNTTGQVVGNTGSGNRASDTLTVMAPLVVAKSFATNPVALNTATLLTVTLTNPNPLPVTGAQFSDNYPSGLVNSPVPGASTTCGGSPAITASGGGSSLIAGGLTVPAHSSCTVTVSVQSAVSGSYANSTGTVTTANAGTAPAASAILNVLAPPVVLKSFTPDRIVSGGQSTMQLIVGNPSANGVALTDVTLTDSYAGTAMTNAADYSIFCTVGSSATVTGGLSGGSSVGITGGIIQPGGTCIVEVPVTATANVTNTTSAPTAVSGTVTGVPATAYLSVLQPLVVSKTFSTYEPAGGTTNVTMTISMRNPNPVAATNVRFTDSYPNVNMTNNPAQTTSPGGNCGAAASLVSSNATNPPSLSFTGGNIPANSTCTVTQVVRFGSNNTVYSNTVTVLTDNMGQSSDTAVVTRGSANARVYFTKSFSPDPIVAGGTTTLTFTITNPHTATASNISFSDPLPAGVTVTNGTQSVCNGTSNLAVTGSNLITLTGGSLAAGASCTFSINTVTAATPGVYLNKTGNISASTGTGGQAEASLTVYVPPGVTKSFGASSFAAGGSTTMTLTFDNLNGAAITVQGSNFTDSFPAGLTLANGTLVNNTCGAGFVTDSGGGGLGQGDTGLRVATGTTIPAGGCSFTVNVTAAAPGNYLNTTSALTTTAGTAPAASAAVTVVAQPPSLSKAFSPAVATVGGTARLIVTLANPNVAPITLTADLTDTFPANLQTAATPARDTTCYTGSGTPATVSGTASTLTLATGAVIPPGTPANPGTCTVSVAVTPTQSGVFTNILPAGSLQTGTGSNPDAATAILTVSAATPPSVSKAFSTTQVGIGMGTPLTLTLTNTNAVAATLTANLDDNLPLGLAVASPSGLSGTCTLGSVTATPGTRLIRYAAGAQIPPGGCTIVVNVSSPAMGTYTNTIDAGALVTDLGNNPGATTDILTVTGLPLLSILKSADVGTANPGQVITYMVRITNSGDGIGTNVVLRDDLSPYSIFKVGSFSFADSGSGLSMGTAEFWDGSSWYTPAVSGGGGAPSGYDGNVKAWRIPMTGNIAAGGSFTLNYQVIVK